MFTDRLGGRNWATTLSQTATDTWNGKTGFFVPSISELIKLNEHHYTDSLNVGSSGREPFNFAQDSQWSCTTDPSSTSSALIYDSSFGGSADNLSKTSTAANKSAWKYVLNGYVTQP